MVWFWLAVTIVFEVLGTMALKYSEGLTKMVPSIAIFVCYGIAFSIFAKVVTVLPVHLAYALWSGIGTMLITVIGILLFKQSLTAMQVILMVLIVGGSIGLKLTLK